ncbi:spindle pole body-associated protein sad1 [Colletotrichum orchidophilum]|uniref:Spindle pole body-associated protein sad1 n=1 Tax=Colletotrichum orchidophilum TaxID=1209926 RepID=A0A1G4ATT8_9PEZI|nr:spindle pole body-associated protein sad1 [Colletotrichum orchidophilum]OHE92589.1 spindle pole body-associated protein sad1 [Colletotrichum orchidophilum]
MPPKRRVRGDDDEVPSLLTQRGAAVRADLPPLASRLDTSYGSAPSTVLRNTRRGQQRNLQDIIKETLHDSDDPDDAGDPDDDDDDDDNDNDSDGDASASSSESSKSSTNQQPPPRRTRRTKSPTPKPAPKSKSSRRVQPSPDPDPDPDPGFEPGFGPGRESSDPPEPSRDATPDPPVIRRSPRRQSPARIAPSVEPPSFQQDAPLPPQQLLPGAAPPRGPFSSNRQSMTRRASSEGPTQGLTPARRALPAASWNSVFARAISEEPYSQSRSRFAQQQDPPEPTPTPDSVRTFGQESSLFGGADIGSTPSQSSSSERDDRMRSIEEIEEPSPFKEETGGINPFSPLRRLARDPRHNSAMPPRNLSHVDRHQGVVQAPITTVSDRPPPEVLPLPSQGTFRPPQREPPSTPPSDRLRPRSSKSPHYVSPARRIAQSPAKRDAPASAASSRQLPAIQASLSPSPAARSNSTLISSRVSEEPSLNHRSPQASSSRNSSPRKPAQPAKLDAARRVPASLAADENPVSSRSLFGDPPPVNGNSAPPRSVNIDTPAIRVVPPRPNEGGNGSSRHSGTSKLFQYGQGQTASSQGGSGMFSTEMLPNEGGNGSTRYPGTSKVFEYGQGQAAPSQGGSGMFNTEMRAKIQEEHRQERARQEALRKERNARLKAWPRVYNTVYEWTNVPRPDSPDREGGYSSDSDGYTNSIATSRQVPSSEFSWADWILFKIADTFVDLLNFLFAPESWLFRASLGILLLSLLIWGALTGLNSTPALGLGGVQWYGLSDFSHNLGQFVPLWMSRPATLFSDNDAREYVRQQRNHEYEITKLTTATKLHEGSLSRLMQILPKVVHMKLDKNGRPVVGEGFYHALRDLMKSDAEVLTLSRGHGGYYFISDETWWAIKSRLQKDPVYQSASSPPPPGLSTTDVENISQSKFDKNWERWLTNNKKKVAKILEPEFSSSLPDKIGGDLESKIEKFVKDRFKNKDTKDVVVTREEFIRHLKGEFATHRNEVKAEAQEMQKKLEHYINESVEAVLKKTPPTGVTRTEMISVVDGMIRQAIANAGLEALAQGKIGATWGRELRHQVNFLAHGSGVIVEATHSTPDYVPPINGKVGTASWLRQTARGPRINSKSATLFGWEDEGDCWCGKVVVGRDGKEDGVRVGYILSREIVPQHIVVEHILPGATLDPNARPKDIDILAYITDLHTRNRVADFAATHFPGSKLSDGWVKIGQFIYESSDTLNGVHVHRLSPELHALGAFTDQIALHITSNYGSDHTCLYRARLYGVERED